MTEPKLFVVANAGTHVALDITAFNDQSLSYKAMGIHGYIRTRPVGQMIRMPDIMLATKDGDHAVRTGVKELLDTDYLHLVKLRNEQGQIANVLYVSMPIPVDIEPKALAAMVVDGRITLPLRDFPQVDNHKVVSAVGGDTEGSPTLPSVGRDTPEHFVYDIPTMPNGIVANQSQSTALASGAAPDPKIDKLFTLWNSLPKLPTHRRGLQYKTYTTIIQHITKALRKHSPMVIRTAIETYAWFLDEPGTVVNGNSPPGVVGLNEFFAFKPYTQGMIDKAGHPLRGMDCWFLECKKGKDYLITAYGKIRKDPNPLYTEAISKAVRNCPVFGGVTWDTIPPRDLNTLAKASALLIKWMDERSDRIPKREAVSMCINRLLMMLSDIGRPLHLGYLVSDITWADFDKYMVTVGAMQPRRHDLRRVSHGVSKAAGKSGT